MSWFTWMSSFIFFSVKKKNQRKKCAVKFQFKCFTLFFKYVIKLKANIIFQHIDCSLFPLGQCCEFLFCNPNEPIVFGAGKTCVQHCNRLPQDSDWKISYPEMSLYWGYCFPMSIITSCNLQLIISILTSVCFIPKCKKRKIVWPLIKDETKDWSHLSFSIFIFLLFSISSFIIPSNHVFWPGFIRMLFINQEF